MEAVRPYRQIMPWTAWYGGDNGAGADLYYPGNPRWWLVYTVCLCVLAVLAALLHDRELPRRSLQVTAALVVVVAVGASVASMNRPTADPGVPTGAAPRTGQVAVLRHAVRSLPAISFSVVLVAIGGWFWLLGTWPSYVWLTAGIAAGVLGAGASRLFDEPAAAIVDTLPRPLWWRTAARGVGAGVLVGVWLVGVWTLDADPSAIHRGLLRLHGVGTVLAVAALCTGLRRRGYASPGVTVGSTSFLVLFFLALSNPMPHLVPLVTDAVVQASTWLWSAIVGIAACGVAAACREV